MNQSELVSFSSQYLIENYGRLPIAFKSAYGSEIIDANGKKYLDLFVGFGAGGIAGHCHPEVVKAIKDQAETLLSHGNLYTSEPQAQVAKLLIEHSFPGKVFFCHSGAEANEAALKLVRKAAGAGRYKIISFENCFHGRTMGGLSLTPASFQEGFEPMLQGNIRLPWGDLESIEKAIDSETAGVFIEPIQGEGGMNVPSLEFMQGLRALCDKHKLLLVCDEVWTAPARTGKWFAYQHFGIIPDVVTCAKSLGGGLPVGACIVNQKWVEVLVPGNHGCTMGGNPLCLAAARAGLELIVRDRLELRAEKLGTKVCEYLQSERIPSVVDIRGKGLMIGIQLDSQVVVRDKMLLAIESGLLIGTAKQNVIRIAPALTIAESDLSRGLEILVEILKDIEVK
jgi:acetylornithine/N-succinyldiaminopimelate aminotransferase